MTNDQIQHEIRYPGLFMLLNIFGILVLLFMAFIGWMAYTQEAVGWGLPTAVLMLFIAVGWLLAVAATPQFVQFKRDHLVIRRWLGSATLAYRDITAVRQSRPFITLKTPDKTLRLYKLYANTDASIMTALERFVPVANAAREKRLYPKLPFTFQNATTGAVGIFVGMFMMFGAGLGSFAFLITETQSVEPFQWVCVPGIGLMSTGFGIMFLYMLVREYPRRYEFTPSNIGLRYLFHTKNYPVEGLQGVAVKEDPRTVRGVPRTVYQLLFHYADGSTVVLEPNGFGFPMDYIDAKEARITAELATRIRHAYGLQPPARQDEAPPQPTPAATAPPPAQPNPPSSGEISMSGPLAPSSPAHALIEQIRRMSDDDYYNKFETLRDRLIALGPEAMPVVLNAARQGRDQTMIDLLVTVLVDMAYPPAMPIMVDWLEHPNEEVRFAAAMSLDSLADGRFNIDGMIVGGWVQHDQITAAVPQMQGWYQSEGHQRVPSVTEWLARRAAMPTYTEQEKRYNFIEINPKWVMLGNGQVFQPDSAYILPRNLGVHVVGGLCLLNGEVVNREAVFEMDSVQGWIQKVIVKENGRWIDVRQHILSMSPHFQF